VENRSNPAFESPSGETLRVPDSYTLFVMMTSEYQHRIRRTRVPASSPVIPAKAGIHCTRVSAVPTTTDLLDYT
jgi:hypothetical protein